MRTIASLILALFVGTSAFGLETDPSKNEGFTPQIIAQKLLEGFNAYKLGDEESCRAIMAEFDLLNAETSTTQLPASTTIDSLIFDHPKLGKWIHFKAVNMPHLRNAEAHIILKDENSDVIFDELKRLLEEQYQTVIKESYDKRNKRIVMLADTQGLEMMDTRFKEVKAIKIPSVYAYEFMSDGEYLRLVCTEIVPAEKVPVDKEEIVATKL